MRQCDLEAIEAFLRDSADAVVDLATFPDYVLTGLSRLIPCDAIGYNEVDPSQQTITVVMKPADARLEADESRFARYMAQHPVIAHQQRTGDASALKLSDFLTRPQFHRLDLYQYFFKHMGAEYQIACGLPAPPPRIIGIALNRRLRDFSERDRLVLNLLRPHLAYLHETVRARARLGNLLAAMEEAATHTGQGFLLLGRDGGVELATAQAAAWVTEYFGGGDAARGVLPATLQYWIDTQRLRSSPTTGSRQLVIERRGKRLVAHFLARRMATGYDALLFEESAEDVSADACVAHGLTPREGQILSCVSQGKANGEIAQILGIRLRTIEKHLEHIYEKLGVGSRTAAFAWILDQATSTRGGKRSLR